MCIITLWKVIDGLWKVLSEVSKDFIKYCKSRQNTIYQGIKDM